MFLSILKSTQPSHQQQQKQKREWLAGSFKPENFIPGLVIGFIFGLLLDLSKANRNHLSKKISKSGKLQQQLSVSSNGDQELKMVLIVRQDLKMKSGKIASQCAHAATGMYAELVHSDRSLLRQWEQCGQPKIVVACRNQQEMNKLKEAADSIGLPTFVVADAGRTQEPSAIPIFLLLGYGESVEKILDVLVRWFVALESTIQELGKVLPETFNPIENGNLPEYTREQVPEGFSRLLISDFNLSNSSWLRLLKIRFVILHQVMAGSKTVLAVGPGPKSYVDSVTGKLPLL